jgi:hypothetical protein
MSPITFRIRALENLVFEVEALYLSAGESAFEFDSHGASNMANSQQLLAPNHLQYGIDGESPARKRKRRFESQVSRCGSRVV